MSDDIVRQRSRSMEEAFFARDDGRSRASLSGAAGIASLASFDLEESIQNERLAQDLRAHHVGGSTAAAMTLVPLIAVAWADRELHARERRAVLEAAEAAGIARDSASHALLERWLSDRPDPELFERWKSFIIALCADMEIGEVEALRAELMGRARAVAEATGGLLGFRRISPREREVLEELEHAFPA